VKAGHLKGEISGTIESADAGHRRLYDVLEALPVYVILLDKDHQVVFANRFFRERFGESQGRPCYNYLFNRAEPCDNCETYKVMKNGAPHHWEWTGPDGRDYDIHDYPFKDSDDSDLILEVGIDLTERKRAQNALKQLNAYHRNLIEVSIDPLVTIDAEGKIMDVNKATEQATGYTREKLIGTDFSTYFTDPGKAADGYRLVLFAGTVKDYPLTIRHKNGKLTDVLYNATVYKDPQGNILGVFAAARDVTELKRTQDELERHRKYLEQLVEERTSQLERANAELLRSNENLEQFAYVASHDLQEPLRIMASYSQLLERRYREKLDQDGVEFIDFIVDAAGRMRKLITDLLVYSRAGMKGVPLGRVDCGQVLDNVLLNLGKAIESTGAKITHDRLPVVHAYESSMVQVFQNLIANALKFRGDATPKIHVGAKKKDSEWVFSVRDNGIGIEPQYHEKIFMIFQRLNPRGEYQGTGIGLSICRKIVEDHGGRIWIESELGRGTTFYFTIPQDVEKRIRTGETDG